MCEGPEDKKGMVHRRSQREGGWSRNKMRRGKGVLDLEGFGGLLWGPEVILREPSSKSAF